jgi:hypothetical protein
MIIKTTKTIQVNENLNLNELKIYKGSSRDVNSFRVEINYKDKLIGEGHVNYVSNFAHITIQEGLMNIKSECDLIDYLVDGLENKTIQLS